ncbi:MAG: PfkB family carbohydrate kinase [Armatimonadota bacterium]|nr:PfkB family carbohydrate kinase [bacterium]
MESKAPYVAGAGVCCVDYIVVAPQIKWGDSIHMTDYLVQGGGLTGTAMVACARLGAKCDMLTMLGDDQAGDQIANELEGEGVALDHVVRTPGGMSPFSFVHVDQNTGERTIFHHPATGLHLDPDLPILENAVQWDALLVDAYYLDLAMMASKAANERGVPVVADIIPNERNAALLRQVDVLIAPRHYARKIGCGDNLDAALDAIHDLGPTTAVITLGSDGWVYSDPSGRGSGNAFKVDVVDTTGAGDTFHGAFAYGLASKWDTRRCAEFASAVAAIKCTKRGGRTGIPSLKQVEEFVTAYQS